MNILQQIKAAKRSRLEQQKKAVSESLLEKSPLFDRKPISMKAFLQDPAKNGVIAEFKRKSPSKGSLSMEANVMETCLRYEHAGVSAISVLTEEDFFAGSTHDFTEARHAVTIPMLRKDFTIDSFQIVEAKSIGADAVLLIAAILTKEEVVAFGSLAKQLGMEVLLEVHTLQELSPYLDQATPALTSFVDIIGINNRNLADFTVRLDTSFELGPLIPDNILRISESGIKTASEVRQLKACGFHGVLIGETLMTTPAALESLSST